MVGGVGHGMAFPPKDLHDYPALLFHSEGMESEHARKSLRQKKLPKFYSSGRG